MATRAWPALLVLTLLLGLSTACSLPAGDYHEDFSDNDAWLVSQGAGANGEVADGVFNFYVAQPGFYWIEAATSGFGPGSYTVTVNQAAGALGVGYGLAFYVDAAQETFYLFEIGSDGFVWLGYCESGCEVNTPLVGDGWFESDAVTSGVGQTHTLRVTTTASGSMIFYVNDTLVGTAQDSRAASGDMALVVEAFDTAAPVQVTFDDLRYSPLAVP